MYQGYCVAKICLSLGVFSSTPLGIFSAFIIDESTIVSGYFLCINWSFNSQSLCCFLTGSETMVHTLLAILVCLGWQE